ncbi:MAG: hypothetical protein GY861_22310 [bacterium]|nr:hypothetical protein [bacterium]
MSTYYGYYCKTCDDQSPHWFPYGGEVLRQLYFANRLLIKNNFHSVEVHALGINNCVWEIEDFLNKHIDHDVVITSEYGDILDVNLQTECLIE